MPFNRERWREASQRFEALVDAAPAEREAELAALRESDSELANLVLRLLAEDAAEAGPLDAGIRGLAPTMVSALGSNSVEALGAAAGPPQIEGLHIGERLGQGGMGEVFRAERCVGGVQQIVALKLLRPGMDSIELRRRFLRERRILADLEHPDIARFVDAGVTRDGRPWLAMEFVDGEPITTYAQRAKLGLRQRVSLMLRVVQAVSFAQSRLVVHRDLKPSNILIDAEGRPRLLDFGIAKLLERPDETEATQTSMRALSPAYAAPEQVADGPISTATDVYALGLVLYEMLTGRLPHARSAHSLKDLGERVARVATQRPSAVLRNESDAASDALALDRVGLERQARSIAGDLDLIVLTALQHESARRYASAQALADDLQRWLEGRAIAARGDSPGYRLRRFVSRHRAAVAASLLVVFSLVGGLSAALWQAQRAEAEAARATAEAERADRSKRYFARLLADTSPTRQRRGAQMSLAELVREAAARIETDLDGLPAEQAEIGLGLANTLSDLGDPLQALEMTNRAIGRLRTLPEGGSALLATALLQRAILLNTTGDSQQAEQSANESLAVLVGLPGDYTLDRIRSRTALLVAARYLGRYAELVEQSQAVLQDRERLLGDPENPALAVDWFNLGTAFALVDRQSEAIDALQRADRLLQRDPQAPEARRAWILNGIGGSQRLAGKLDEAEQACMESESIARRTLGDTHAMVANALLCRGLVARDRGEVEQAEAWLARALSLLQEGGNEMQARVQQELGELLLERGAHLEAARTLEQASAVLSERSADGDPQAWKSDTALALALARSGNIDVALRLSSNAMVSLETWRVQPNRFFGEAALNHAEVLQRAGNADEATAWRRRGEQDLSAIWSDDHPRHQMLLATRGGSPP